MATLALAAESAFAANDNTFARRLNQVVTGARVVVVVLVVVDVVVVAGGEAVTVTVATLEESRSSSTWYVKV
jgi:hypothetical protein